MTNTEPIADTLLAPGAAAGASAGEPCGRRSCGRSLLWRTSFGRGGSSCLSFVLLFVSYLLRGWSEDRQFCLAVVTLLFVVGRLEIAAEEGEAQGDFDQVIGEVAEGALVDGEDAA